MKRFLSLTSCVASAVLAAAVAAPSAHAISITTADGAGADTFVQGSPSNQNFGNGTAVVIKNGAAVDTFARKGYLKFDLSSLPNLPAASATLQLMIDTNNGGGTDLTGKNFTVELFALNNEALDNWIEGNGGTDNLPAGEITWANAPGNNTGSGNAFNASATSLGTFNVLSTDGAGAVVSFSGLGLLNAINADTNNSLTLMLRRNGANAGGSNNLAFRSKENATVGSMAPTLIVNFIPEPATASLALVGLALLGRRHRRMA